MDGDDAGGGTPGGEETGEEGWRASGSAAELGGGAGAGAGAQVASEALVWGTLINVKATMDMVRAFAKGFKAYHETLAVSVCVCVRALPLRCSGPLSPPT